MGRHRRAVTLLVLSCALVAVTAVAVGAPPGTSPGVESGDGSTEAVLVERVEIHSVSEGDVTATLVYELPPSLKSLSVRIETGDVETVDTNGFEEWGDQRYGWIDNETTASVTVRYDVTEGFNLDEWFDAPVDGGEEWGIVTRPQTETMWRPKRTPR